MGKISYKKELIIYCFTLLMTALLFGNNILLYQGKKAALIMAVIVTVIDVLSAILAKKYISIVNQLSAGLFFFFHRDTHPRPNRSPMQNKTDASAG